MLNVEIICAGRIKESHYQAACSEYSKRLSPHIKLSVIEQPEGKPLKITDDNVFTIALTPAGTEYSSEAWAAKIKAMQQHHSRLRFLIGGSDGLFPQDLELANETLSLSRMTFTHAMARVLLHEQLYRACMIQTGRKYHK